MTVITTLSLAFAASLFYVGAAVFLKQWSSFSPPLAIVGILFCLAAACAAELMLLQRLGFADVVVLVITLEVGLAVVLARLAYDESFALRDMGGMAFLLIGTALLVWHPIDDAENPAQSGEAETASL